MFEFIFLALIVLLVFLIQSNIIVVVPARRFAIVESLGSFCRVIMPGVHVIWFPLQKLRTIRWSYVEQNGQLKTISTNMPSFEVEQMDIPQLECLTKENISVSVDMTVFYQISDLKLATYETGDVLNFFYQYLCQAVRNTVSNTTVADLHGKDAVLAMQILKYVNEMMTEPSDRGIRCRNIMVQQLRLSKDMLAVNQNFEVEKRKHETFLMAKYKEQEQRKLQLQTDQLDFDAKMAKYKALQTQGFTPGELVELERITALKNATNATVVYAPYETFVCGSSILKNQFPNNK